MFDLYLITPDAPEARVVELVQAALDGAPRGRVGVQLRAKQLGARELLSLALRLRTCTHEAGAPLLVNDRLDVALLAEADGVHLPEAGLPAAAARRLLPRPRLVGVSCHDARGLAVAREADASFATLGPVAPTPGKPAELDGATFARLAASSGLPVLALGGVTAKLVHGLILAGAAGVAVIRGVFDHPRPGEAVCALLAAVDDARARAIV